VLGWKPRVGFSDLVRMMYESDLEEERAKQKK
jgi:GDP-D-mannose dehydratase